eukprot:TRINITY_DN1869_c0_g1_i2.p1 TRINITY_DN1869_c0_g1~~TRINITY_DN1869_c0_g1_i2.p1  ORF type:complete len:235 (-),score=7.27 TRINITY_DN1869_c0_g1_i2:59-763(-)
MSLAVMETKRSSSPTKSKLQADDNFQLEQLQSHWKIAKPRRKSSSPTSSRSPTPPKKMVDFVSHWKIPKSSSRPSSPPSIEDDSTPIIHDSISAKPQHASLGTSHRNNLLASPESDGSVISSLLALSATPPYTTYFFPNHTVNAAPVDRVVSCSDNQRKRPISNPSEDVQEPAWKKSCHRPADTSFVYSGSETYYTTDVHQPLNWSSSSNNPSLVSHEAQQTRHKMSITQIVQN